MSTAPSRLKVRGPLRRDLTCLSIVVTKDGLTLGGKQWNCPPMALPCQNRLHRRQAASGRPRGLGRDELDAPEHVTPFTVLLGWLLAGGRASARVASGSRSSLAVSSLACRPGRRQATARLVVGTFVSTASVALARLHRLARVRAEVVTIPLVRKAV